MSPRSSHPLSSLSPHTCKSKFQPVEPILNRSSRFKKTQVVANNSRAGETSLRATTKDKQRRGWKEGNVLLLVGHSSRADRSHGHKLAFSWQPGRTFKTDRRCFYCFPACPTWFRAVVRGKLEKRKKAPSGPC